MQKIGKSFQYFIFLVCSLFFVNVYAASQVQLEVELDSKKVGVGEQVQVVLTVNASDEVEIEEPQAPKIEYLKLLQAQKTGVSQSTQIKIINGQTEYTKNVSQSFIFIYQAIKPGAFTIPGFTIKVDGRVLKSESKSMVVTKEAQGKKNNARGRPQYEDNPFDNEDDDPFMQLFKQQRKMLEDQLRQQGLGGGLNNALGGGQRQQIQEKTIPNVNPNEAFFVYLDSDKSEAYEGEQITANWYLYVRGEISSLDRAKFPDLKGFWKEIIEEVPALQFYPEIVNGVMYKKALLASHALFPIKAGVAVIDEFKIKAKVALPTQFGFGQPFEYTKASRRKEIKVLPLPLEGRPLSFSGAVGEFQIQTQLDGTEFPMGQPFSLKVRFEGMGNAKLIDLPTIEWPSTLEVYDTKSESKFFKEGNSYKEYEILLIPKAEGKINIPQINFSYFDPATKKYITKSTESFDITVTPAAKNTQTGGQSFSTTKSEAKEETILLPVLDAKAGSFDVKNPQTFMKGLFLFSILALLLQLLLFVIQYLKISTASVVLQKIDSKLQLINQYLKNNEIKNIGIESINLLYLLVSGLTHQESQDQNWQNLLQKMPEHLRKEHESTLVELYDYFQVLGYAPAELRDKTFNQNELSNRINTLKNTSTQIKQELK